MKCYDIVIMTFQGAKTIFLDTQQSKRRKANNGLHLLQETASPLPCIFERKQC